MKNILITGSYKTLENGRVLYDINLWGQTTGSPNITLIVFVTKEMGGYSDLMIWASEKFCNYFNCTNSNIAILNHFIHIKH